MAIMKSKKLILIAHCLLNQNAVVEGWERARGAFPIVELLLNEGIGIIQLPCPELIFSGMSRPPLTYADYDVPDYRNLCRRLAIPYVDQLKEYAASGYLLMGILSIHGSPSCSISGERGVFIEELYTLCERENIFLNYAEIPEAYNEQGLDKDLELKVLNLIRGLSQ